MSGVIRLIGSLDATENTNFFAAAMDIVISSNIKTKQKPWNCWKEFCAKTLSLFLNLSKQVWIMMTFF